MSVKFNITLSEDSFNGMIHVLKNSEKEARIPVVVSKEDKENGCFYTVEVEDPETLVNMFISCTEEITKLKTKIGSYQNSLSFIQNLIK